MKQQNPDENLEGKIRNLQEQANQIRDETIKNQVIEQIHLLLSQKQRVPFQPRSSEEERIWRLIEGPVVYYVDNDSLYCMRSGQIKELTEYKSFFLLGGLALSPDKKRLAFHAARSPAAEIWDTAMAKPESLEWRKIVLLDPFERGDRKIYIVCTDESNLRYIDDRLNALKPSQLGSSLYVPHSDDIPTVLDCHNPRWVDNETIEYEVSIRWARQEKHRVVLKANNDISTGPFKVT